MQKFAAGTAEEVEALHTELDEPPWGTPGYRPFGRHVKTNTEFIRIQSKVLVGRYSEHNDTGGLGPENS